MKLSAAGLRWLWNDVQGNVNNRVWVNKEGDSYLVTGTTVSGKKFTIITTSWMKCQGINLFRGRKYLVREGRRKLLMEVL